MLTPAGVLLVPLRGVLTLALLAGSAMLFHEWYERLPVARPPMVEQGDVPIAADETPVRDRPWTRITRWRPGWDERTAFFLGGLAILLFSFGGGRFFNPRMLRKAGAPVPQLTGGKPSVISRPDGTRLYVETFGSKGPIVIATHGWGTDRQEWAYLRELADKNSQLVVWDLPGLGRSTRPDNQDYSLEKFAHDLRAVMDNCGPEPITLLGHSIGGMTILTFCRLFPELLGSRVSGIILTHTTYKNPLRTMLFSPLFTALEKPVIVPLLYLQIALSPLIWLSNCLSYFNGSMHWSNTFTGFGGTETRSKLDFISQYSLTSSPAVLSRGCLGMLNYDATDVLRRIPVPVLVVSGDRDPVTLPSASTVISKDVRSGALTPLTPAKHYGFFEHDEAFLDLVSQFCHRRIQEPTSAAVAS